MGINEIHQGDLLKVERIKCPVLVVSKDFFNRSGKVIGCPVFSAGPEGPLHIRVRTGETDGFVQCENMKLLDLTVRGFSEIGRIPFPEIMNITDAIQGIFDYV